MPGNRPLKLILSCYSLDNQRLNFKQNSGSDFDIIPALFHCRPQMPENGRQVWEMTHTGLSSGIVGGIDG